MSDWETNPDEQDSPIAGKRNSYALEPEKSFTLEGVGAILAEKSRDSFTAQFRDFLHKYNAQELIEVDLLCYKDLVRN